MSRQRRTPQEKKADAYTRDHYTRGGESVLAWRAAKSLKKRKAIRAARHQQRTALVKVEPEPEPGMNARRRLTTVRQKKVVDWGVMNLREFVDRKRQGGRQIKPGH